MTGEGIRRSAALAVAALAAAVLIACGDSGSSVTETSPTGEVGSNPRAGGGPGSRKAPEGEPGSKRGSGGDEEPAPVKTVPLEVSGGGSAQYRVKGGDNSIQEFGEEGEEGELEEAATALHDYLVARAEEDWPTACSRLARTVRDQLDELASRSGQLEGKGCATILGALTPLLPANVRRESTIVDAGSLRIEDGRAFLIYRGAEETGYAVLMEEEEGAWKVGALTATPIS